MSTESVLPAWAADAQVDDEVFARAYDAMGPEGRAVLKTCAARLYALHRPAGIGRERRQLQFFQGFSASAVSEPRPWAVLLLGAGVRAPAPVLAALMPCLTAGIPEVSVVRDPAHEWPPALLAALELAGQETVLDIPSAKFDALVSGLAGAGKGQGCVLAMGAELPPSAHAAGIGAHTFPHPLRVGVYDDAGEADLERLALACAGAQIDILADGSVAPLCTFEEFCKTGRHGVLVSESRVETALDSFPLVLGPGEEGLWVFGEPEAGFFRQKAIAVTSPTTQQSP